MIRTRLLSAALCLSALGAATSLPMPRSVPAASVLAAVKASVAIQDVPAGLSPSFAAVASDSGAKSVAGTNYLLKSCDPYWTHALAAKPIPCVYGSARSKRTVVLFGDSNAASWTPALDAVFKTLGYRLDLFGFIGCTTAPVTETATSQPGFPGQWQLCNTWHKSLPAAVRALKPVAVIDAASPWVSGDLTEDQQWVGAMKWAFDEMTLGRPRTARIELGTTPLFPSSVPTCLQAHPTNIQSCGVDYSSASSLYAWLLARDTKIAATSHATLLPSWQWFCYASKCSPVIKNFMVMIDRDHTSTPFVMFLQGALLSEFRKDVRFP